MPIVNLDGQDVTIPSLIIVGGQVRYHTMHFVRFDKNTFFFLFFFWGWGGRGREGNPMLRYIRP